MNTLPSAQGQGIKSLWRNINKPALIFAIIHFIVFFIIDKLTYAPRPFELFVPLPLDVETAPMYFLATRILSFVVLFVVYQIFAKVIVSAKKGNRRALFDFILPFGILLGFYLFNFIICYPGIYNTDDMPMYAFATQYLPFYWHNYLTSLFHMVGLWLCPVPSGQMVLLDIFTALVFAYIFYRLSAVLADKRANKWKYLLFVVAAFPFINTITLESFRPYMYSIPNLFLFAYLILEKIQKRKLTWTKFILLALCIGLLVEWRSESLVYLAFAPFLLCIAYTRAIGIKKALLFTVAALIMFFGVNLPQQSGNDKYYNSDYTIVSTIRPLSVLLSLNETYKYPGSSEDVSNITKVVNVSQITAHPFSSIGFQSWNTINNEGRLSESGASKEDQAAYLKSFVNLVLHNPGNFMKERLDLFYRTNFIDSQIDFGKKLVEYETPIIEPYLNFTNILRATGWIPTGMTNPGEAYFKAITLNWAPQIYSVIPCLILALFLIILSVRYKAWLFFTIELIILLREAIVFLTSPASNYSYYMPTSLLSLFVGVLLIIFAVYNKKTGEKKKLFV